MRYLIVLLVAGCAAPTAGDLRWMSAPTEVASARSSAEAAGCIAKAMAGAQGFMGTTQTIGMAERSGAWEVTARSASGVIAQALVESSGNGSRITVWELGDEQARRAALECR